MEPSAYRAITFITLGILIVVCACGVSQGSLFERTRPLPRGEDTAAPTLAPPWPKLTPLPEGQKRLFITSYPEKAEIWLDKNFYGLTPISLPDFPFGDYFLEIRKHGYDDLSGWISFQKTEQEFYYPLVLTTGVLDVRTDPPHARVTVSAGRLAQGRNVISAGRYKVSISAFGYRNREMEIDVAGAGTTPLTVVLERAVFSFQDLRLSRPVFNPGAVGPASEIALFFTVAGPGSGVLQVADEAGRIIAQRDFPYFSDSEYSIAWNGRDAAGRLLGNGRYTFLLQGNDADASGEGAASTQAQADIDFRIDAGLDYERQSLWSGSSGLLYAPSPAVLPGGAFQISAASAGGFSETGGLTAPVTVGARIGLGFSSEIAVGLFGLLEASPAAPADQNQSIFGAGFSYKWRILSASRPIDFEAALLAKGAYLIQPYSDFFADASGFSIGLPLELKLGPLSLFFSPEFILGLYKIPDDPAAAVVPGAFGWFYGRIGLQLTAGIFSLGASLSLRTASWDEGFRLALPLLSALEIAFYFPETPLYISLFGILSWGVAPLGGWAGLGFGLLW